MTLSRHAGRLTPALLLAALALGGCVINNNSRTATSAEELPDVAKVDQPTYEVEAVLRDLGYTSWDNIARSEDRSLWRIDDAVHEDGHVYDLSISARDWVVVERDRED